MLCLQKDREELIAFCDFLAQHWQSIRTSNPIESTSQNWLCQRGFEYLAQIIAGVKFRNGIEVTESNQASPWRDQQAQLDDWTTGRLDDWAIIGDH